MIDPSTLIQNAVTPQDARSDVDAMVSALKAAAAPAPQATPGPVRLVVEPIHGGKDFTYKLYDRFTGALIIELPRTEVTKIGESANYTAGQVIDTQA